MPYCDHRCMEKVSLKSPCIVQTKLSHVVCFIVENLVYLHGNIKKEICECLLSVWWVVGAGQNKTALLYFLAGNGSFQNASFHI